MQWCDGVAESQAIYLQPRKDRHKMGSLEQPENHHMGQVVPGVWVGSLASLSHLDPRRNWTVITILFSNRMVKLACDVLAHSNAEVHEHVVWVLSDTVRSNLLSEHHLLRVFGILDKANSHNACLVHCAQGVSRSVAVCTAWLLSSRRHKTLSQALERIRHVRPIANPNLGFLAALRALEQCEGDVSKARERLTRLSHEKDEEIEATNV